MMIQLAKLFTPVSSMDADAAKDYMTRHREGEYTLLDVRQPGEYEDSHLPGAKLMPLPQLPDTYQALDPDKPTLVHCAVGGRSRVAAQMLSGWGFKEVYNLAGGIKAIHTPGHSAGHLVFLWPGEGGVLFTGDAANHMAGLNGPPIREDGKLTEESLEKLSHEKFRVACFGHGEPIVGGADMQFRARWGGGKK